ncbi:MAG: PLP-dependent aminotransferase family protein [Acidobacteriota bacterium]
MKRNLKLAIEESTQGVDARAEILLADRVYNSEATTLREMLSLAARPHIISFALGLPAAELLCRENFAEAATEVLRNDLLAMQLGPPFQPLKRHIVSIMAQRGVTCSEEQIFLTTGAQQGLNLLASLLLNYGQQVIIEETTYTGIHKVIEPFQPKILTVPAEPVTGMDIDALEAILKDGVKPAFIYTMADGHNPLGVSMTLANRMHLVALARQYQVPIIEDDAYGLLFYENQMSPPLRALEEEWVLYVGSFSKILGPGLRTGWLVVPSQLIPKLSIIKDYHDIDSCTLTQRTISAFLDTGALDAQLVKLQQTFRTCRDLMINALAKYFPADAYWQKPTSGVFIWVVLPNGIDTTELLKIAIEQEQVAFMPGSAFCIKDSYQATNCMRLCFTNCKPAQIEKGIAQLARAIQRYK